ncbi:MAG: 50S ribosomal protein L18 [Helicobacter sp.]|nr:50S ribosomal protein L18 [Helicobacter sp.]
MLEKAIRQKNRLRIKRKMRTRSKIYGTAKKPRLSVFRSNRYLYAQVIDDEHSTPLAVVDGKTMGLKANKQDAKNIAYALADKLKSKEIRTVVFDRNGYLYHGVIAAFADSLREKDVLF